MEAIEGQCAGIDRITYIHVYTTCDRMHKHVHVCQRECVFACACVRTHGERVEH